MQESFSPESEKQLVELVAYCLSEDKTLSVFGSNSHSGFGYPVTADFELSLSACSGILEYEPAELVMRARAGTTLREIESVLAEQHQQLAFEPQPLSAFYQDARADNTIAAVFAANLSGSRRFQAGSARDHLLGFRGINGRGELYKSGGNVIKNVTGYDLSKLMCGSWGTLSILSEVSFKVLPAPGYTSTACIEGLDIENSLQILSRVAASPLQASGLSLLPANRGFSDFTGLAGDNNTCLLRFEGSATSVKARLEDFRKMFKHAGRLSLLEQEHSAELWKIIGAAKPLASKPVVVKISLAPSLAGKLGSMLAVIPDCCWYFDAAGAWLWLGLEATNAASHVKDFRAALAEGGGSVVIYKAPEPIKYEAGIFSSSSSPLEALQNRVKDSFDPGHIFNPAKLGRPT